MHTDTLTSQQPATIETVTGQSYLPSFLTEQPDLNRRNPSVRQATAEVIGGSDPLVRIYPVRIVSWGLEREALGDLHARTVESGRR